MSYLPLSPDYSIQTTKHSFSSTDILGLSTPYTLVPAISGKVVIGVSAFVQYTHVTTAYANPILYLGWGGTNQSFTARFIDSLTSTNRHIVPSTNTLVLSNSPFQIWAPVAPINGDGYFTIYLSYYILTL